MGPANNHKDKKRLAHVDDTKFLEDCFEMLLNQGALPTLQQDASIDDFLQQIMYENRQAGRQAIIKAMMDLYTRAYLSQLCETSQRPMKWHSISINWMESPDNMTACHDDKTLYVIGSNHILKALCPHAPNTAMDVRRTMNYIRGILETQLTRL